MYRIYRSAVQIASLLATTTLCGQQSPLHMASSSVTLSDVLPRSQSIGIFSSLCNDIPSVSELLATNVKNLTVLAPEDTEIKKLPRKPWEDPADYDRLGTEAYVGEEGVDRAQNNLKRFVEAHVVPASPWAEGEKIKRLSAEGGEIYWESKDGKKIVRVCTATE
jgi:hypothetical protein